MISIFTEKRISAKNFFDLPAKEKKKMITISAKEANRMQASLVSRVKDSY